MRSLKVLFGIVAGCSMLLSACATPAKIETTQTVAYVYTEVALTYEAQRTQNALLTPSATLTHTPTVTPLPPTETPTPPEPSPTLSPTPSLASSRDRCEYVSQSIPDYSIFAPGEPFTMTWTLRNSGDFTWTTSYQARFYAGNPLGAPSAVPLTKEVKPNQTYDLTVEMVAPDTPNTYNSIWVITSSAENGGINICSFYVYIKVQ